MDQRNTFNCCSEISVGGHWTICTKCRPWCLCYKITCNWHTQISLGTPSGRQRNRFCCFNPLIRRNRNFAFEFFLLGCHMCFYALWYICRDDSFLYVSGRLSLYWFPCIVYWRLALKYLYLVKIGQKYGALYLKTEVRFIGSGDIKSV